MPTSGSNRSWRDRVLREFTPELSRLTLVADPDGLLLDEGISAGIRQRGFDIIEFEDHVAFRYAYESTYRTAWDRGEATDLVVVLRSGLSDLASLPYDLLQAGRHLAFGLPGLFPNLTTSVVAALDSSEFDGLWAAQAQYSPGCLGENATKDFVLRHVFEVAPELITKPSDLLRVLLRRHYRQLRIPAVFDERLITLLRQAGRFGDWPIEVLVPDRGAFLRFLQERWPLFVERLSAGGGISEPRGEYPLEMPGPAILPFEHDDVRVYVDNLFSEGLLVPIEHAGANSLKDHWASAGLVISPSQDRARRFAGLRDAVVESLPGEGARHQEWLVFAQRWATLLAALCVADADMAREHTASTEDLRARVGAAFQSWALQRFAGLHNQPPCPPVMVHHVPRKLAHEREVGGGKVALVVVDGLALDQWLTIRSTLMGRDAAWRFHESPVFAWVPTLTSISRQAIFAGRAPLYFPASIQTTDKEPQLWTQFWADHGLAAANVGYLRGLGEVASLGAVKELVEKPGLKALGLVVDTVDRIMHGMELGARGMHGQIRQWVEEGFPWRLLALLLEAGFRVFLTSDHGNSEAVGCGRPSEGVLADVKGERVRVYPTPGLRDMTASRFPSAIAWPSTGLPSTIHALLAPPGRAFVGEGERVVAHGGVSIEEVIVPFVEIKRLDT